MEDSQLKETRCSSYISVEVTKTGETIKINERNEVEREIMTCLSKRFSLTNDNLTMGNNFISQIGYLAEKNEAADIFDRKIPQALQCDTEIRECLEMLALPEIKDIYQLK